LESNEIKSDMKYWDILCERRLEILFRKKISATHISEKNLVEFIRTLLSKYGLSDDEILEQYLSIPFKKKKDYINVHRGNNIIGEQLSIIFSAQIADISVTAQLKS
jgi:hypothetical protein